MSAYLHFSVGPHQLLLAAARVEEIVEAAGSGSGRRRPYRGDSVPLITLRALRSVRAPATYHVVARDGERGGTKERVMIAADAVHRLLELDDSEFRRLPPVDARLAAMFDGVWLERGASRVLLRLRHPFGWREDRENAGA